jgi:DNA-3-methyladenine glycosylase II
LFCLGHGDAWPAGDLAVQEGIRIGLSLKARPTEKQMAPLAEPWRPLRGAAAHLWWSYYRAIKKREGVIAGEAQANTVLNNVAVAKRPLLKEKMPARKMPGSKP